MGKVSVIRITKEFRFEAAHALWNYDGLCKNIHGHSYILYVTIKGSPVSDPEDPKFGMVMDFSQLKKIVKDAIIGQLDHSLMVNANTPHKDLAEASQMFGRVVALPYQPTCENMIIDFAARLKALLPAHVSLHSLRLHETATSYAEWLTEENEK
ncbi:MAG: 6-carboxytetrahydropterin synthase [Bacteroides sp.]|jgi:6-pyruvoyltetrahydropterin/6-carboxytetrahydropterin synthase|nr:6-carboxytetrahydropterin synthase [Bacteroides sp.]